MSPISSTGKVRRLHRIITGGETLDYVAQANHRVEHPAFENEAEDEQNIRAVRPTMISDSVRQIRERSVAGR